MTSPQWRTIDCQYLFPRFAAAFLRVEKGRSIFVENNTAHAIPHLLEALKVEGCRPETVDYLIVTHAHLDHAGGTGKLLECFPEAVVLAHPKAARTLKDPARLIASAKKVYGEKTFEKLYGEVKPVSPERIRELQDGEEWTWQGISFQTVHTEGHASHHLCLFDASTRSVFTGDAFGLSYPDLKGQKPFHIPSTSPIDFDFEKATASVDKILELNSQVAYLTHYGPVENLTQRAEIMKRHLRFHQDLIEDCDKRGVPDFEVEKTIHQKLATYFDQELKANGIKSSELSRKLLKLDLDLNASGLAFSCLKRRKQAS